MGRRSDSRWKKDWVGTEIPGGCGINASTLTPQQGRSTAHQQHCAVQRRWEQGLRSFSGFSFGSAVASRWPLAGRAAQDVQGLEMKTVRPFRGMTCRAAAVAESAVS